jgi:hypothetical protein
MSEYYNQSLKERFINEMDLSDTQLNHYTKLFQKTKKQEEALGKDIFQMNKEECTVLLHFFNARSIQYLKLMLVNLRFYVEWCDRQGLIPHHVNYFYEFSSRKMNTQFVSNTAMENQIISREQLDAYVKELTDIDDYQGAVIISLLFNGINLNQVTSLCELANIKVRDIDLINNAIKTINKRFFFDDKLKNLIQDAIEQKDAVDYEGMARASESTSKKPKSGWYFAFNNPDFLIKSKKKAADTRDEPTKYNVICIKIRAISEYLNNPYINPTYLNLSGMIDYIRKNYTEADYDKTGKGGMKVYEDIIERYGLDTTVYNLKARLLPLLWKS